MFWATTNIKHRKLKNEVVYFFCESLRILRAHFLCNPWQKKTSHLRDAFIISNYLLLITFYDEDAVFYAFDLRFPVKSFDGGVEGQTQPAEGAV